MGSKQRRLKKIPPDSEFELLVGQLSVTEELAVEVLGNVQAVAERLTAVGESLHALSECFHKSTDTKAMADPCARFQFANRGVQQQSAKLASELLASVVGRIVKYLAVFGLFKERVKRKDVLQAEYEKKRARLKRPAKDGELLDESDPKADAFWHVHQLYATGVTELLDDMRRFYWHRSHFFAEFLHPIAQLECEIGSCLSRMTEEDLSPIKQAMEAAWESARRDPAAELSTLSGIIQDADMCPVFEAFLDKEFSGENLRFYKRVEHYVTITNQREREKMAKEVFDTYVKPGAEFQVNVDAAIVQSLRDMLTDRSKITERLFDEAFDMISELMTRDSLARFAKTTEYRDVLCRLKRGSLAFWDKVVQECVVEDSPMLVELMKLPEEEKLRERERQRQKEEKEREKQRAKELREEEKRRKEEERDRLEREKQEERRRKEEERDRAERERQEKIEREKQEREREKLDKQRLKEEKQQPKTKKPRGKESKDSASREDDARSPRSGKAEDRALPVASASPASAAVLSVPGKPEVQVEVPVLPFARDITTGRSQLRKTRVLDNTALPRSASMTVAERGSGRPGSGVARNSSFAGSSGSFAGARGVGSHRGGGGRGGSGRGRGGGGRQMQRRASREEPSRTEPDGVTSLRGARASLRPAQRSRTASGVFVGKNLGESSEEGNFVRTAASSGQSPQPAASSGLSRSVVSSADVVELPATAPASVSVSPVSPASYEEVRSVDSAQSPESPEELQVVSSKELQVVAVSSDAETVPVALGVVDDHSRPQNSEYEAAVAGAAVYEGASRETDLELCDEATYDAKYGSGAYRVALDETYGRGVYEAAYDEAYGPGAYQAAYDESYGAGAYELAHQQEAAEWAAYEAAVAEAQAVTTNYDGDVFVDAGAERAAKDHLAALQMAAQEAEIEPAAVYGSTIGSTVGSIAPWQAPGDFGSDFASGEMQNALGDAVSADFASGARESDVPAEPVDAPQDQMLAASQAVVEATAADFGASMPSGGWGDEVGGDWEENMLAATDGLSFEGEDHSMGVPSMEVSTADDSILAELSVMEAKEFDADVTPSGDVAVVVPVEEPDVTAERAESVDGREYRPKSPEEEVYAVDPAVEWGIEAPAAKYVDQEDSHQDPFGARLVPAQSRRKPSPSIVRAKVGPPPRVGAPSRPDLAHPPSAPPSLRSRPSSMLKK